MTLIQLLLKKGMIDKKKVTSLEYEIKVSGKGEEEVILEQGILSEEALFALKSEILKMPLRKVISEEVPLEVLELILLIQKLLIMEVLKLILPKPIQ